MKLVLKILSRLGVLQYINYTATVSINNIKSKVPIIGGLGLSNLNQKSSWFTKLIKQLYKHYPNHEFVDIGANIGQTFIQVQSAAPQWKYSGFEPNVLCASYLNKLVKANQSRQSKIYPYAVSNTSGKMHLFLNSPADTTATIIDSFRPRVYDHAKTNEITVIKFDEFYNNEMSKDSLYILKIDIEGAEHDALQGMTNFLTEKRPIIICEVLDTHSESTLAKHKLRLNGIESLLDNLNYNRYQIIRTENDQKIKDFKRIQEFERKIWTAKSVQLNDYLFIPKENQLNLKSFLN